MDSKDREELKRKISAGIEETQGLIESLAKSAQPVAPDNAIGRLTRMEAIGSKEVAESALQSAKAKLANLETALTKVDDPDFGICIRCSHPIPHGRIMLMPESVWCVACAETRR